MVQKCLDSAGKTGVWVGDEKLSLCGLVFNCSVCLCVCLFTELDQLGSDQNCLWVLNKTFHIWSSSVLLQLQLVEEGVLSGIVFQLEMFKDCPSNEV